MMKSDLDARLGITAEGGLHQEAFHHLLHRRAARGDLPGAHPKGQVRFPGDNKVHEVIQGSQTTRSAIARKNRRLLHQRSR